MTDFFELIGGVRRDGDTWTADVSEDWRQGRTLFGGLCGALCLEAANREFTDLPPLRSAQFALVGPGAGKIMARLSMLRRGKSTVFVGADLFSEEGLATRATFGFAAPRPSAYNYAMDAMPEVKTPEQSTPFRERSTLRSISTIDWGAEAYLSARRLIRACCCGCAIGMRRWYLRPRHLSR